MFPVLQVLDIEKWDVCGTRNLYFVKTSDIHPPELAMHCLESIIENGPIGNKVRIVFCVSLTYST